MRNTQALLALLSFMIVTILPINGQTPFTLDSKTTTFIDNALMECFYDYTVKAHPRNDTINKTVAITYNTLLQANATTSKFWDWHTFKRDSIIFTSVTSLPEDSLYKIHAIYNIKVKYLFIPIVFKNQPKGMISVIDDIAPCMYLYQQPKSGLAWILSEDTMTVCGYLCNKAVASYGGREWTAWYAPDIAISDGPWKLYGLPGLILKAIDSTGEHSFDAVVIRNTERPIYMTKDFQRLEIKKEKFLKQKQEFDIDPFKNLSLNPTIKYLAIIEGEVYINGTRFSFIVDFVYRPLELN